MLPNSATASSTAASSAGTPGSTLNSVTLFQACIKRWEEGKADGSQFDPTPCLIEMAELLEKEYDNYLAKDPDPFEDRHPSRVDPDCQLGQVLKCFFKKESLVQDIFNHYTRDNYWTRLGIDRKSFDLNVAACRVVLDILPGLETAVLMDIDSLIKRLYVWAEKADQPLQSYAIGLLAVAMEHSDVATDPENRERNTYLIPIVLNRLRVLRGTPVCVDGPGSGVTNANVTITQEPNFKRPFHMFEGKSSHKLLHHDCDDDQEAASSVSAMSSHTGPPSFEPEWSNSSWAEMESQVIAKFHIYPLTPVAEQIFILRMLAPLGEYQEFMTFIFEQKILELLMSFIKARENRDARLSFEALKFLSALFCHKKFVLEFVTSPLGCIAALLDVPRPSIAATAVSQCLYYIGCDDDAMEKVCLLPLSVLQKMVKYVLWLVECSHDSGRQFATMFFGLACSYRTLLHIFDDQDCVRRVYNTINTLPILNIDEQNLLTDDQEYNQRQQVRQVMVAFKRYVEAHLAIKAEQYKSPINRTPVSKAVRYTAFQVSEFVEILMECMPFRARWPPIDKFIDLGCVQKCLQVIALAYDWTFSGRAEMVRSALDILAICATVPKVQFLFCERVDLPDDLKQVGINILLGAAEGEIVQDSAEVQKSALNVLINCVCAPVCRPGGNLSRFAGGTLGSWVKKKSSGKSSEELINMVWNCVRTNNGIMTLLQMLQIKTPLTDADSIRALACRALVGLARSSAAKQIMSKLPIFSSGQLQQLVREPVLQDKRAEHVKFQHHAHELMELVSGPGGPRKLTGDNDFSLEMLHRASVVAQTKITFSKKQLLQLIQEYLLSQSLLESAGALQREASLPASFRHNSHKSLVSGAPTPTAARAVSVSRANASVRVLSPNNSAQMSPTPGSSPWLPQPIRIIRSRRITSDYEEGRSLNSVSIFSSPSTPSTVRSLQKAYDAKVQAEMESASYEESSRVTLVSIVSDYLSNQHSLCKNPMVTCPEFDLFTPHKCPDPRPKHSAPLNIAMRMNRRGSSYPPFGGMDGRKLDRKLVYSRFRPVKSFRDVSEDTVADNPFTSCIIMPGDQYLLAGTYRGDVKMFNIHTGTLESTYNCHETQIFHLETNREGSLLLTSNTWRQPYSCLWSFGEFFEVKQAFQEEDYAEFSKLNQDKVITTKGGTAKVYDIATSQVIVELRSLISNNYQRNRATFDPNDELVLNDGVLYDIRMGKEIKKLDKLNPNLNGVFHPNGLEIVSNSEVWDLRTFHLLKTVPGLDQCQVKFSHSGEIIYAVSLETENEEDEEQHDSSFKTFDASDYSGIATIDTRRTVWDLSSSTNDLGLAVVENTLNLQANEESVVRLYDVGRLRGEEEAEDADEDEENDEDGVALGNLQDEDDDEEEEDDDDDEDEEDEDEDDDDDDDDDEDEDDDDEDDDDDDGNLGGDASSSSDSVYLVEMNGDSENEPNNVVEDGDNDEWEDIEEDEETGS